jgi:hypothetical protein
MKTAEMLLLVIPVIHHFFSSHHMERVQISRLIRGQVVGVGIPPGLRGLEEGGGVQVSLVEWLGVDDLHPEWVVVVVSTKFILGELSGDSVNRLLAFQKPV